MEEFDQLIGEIQPFEGAHELLAEVKERGFRLVLASSGKTQHVEAFLDLIDAKSLADAWTTSDDVKHSKPEPDIVATALAKVDGASAVMVGDSIFDAQAGGKLKIPTLGVAPAVSRSGAARSRRPAGLRFPGGLPPGPGRHPPGRHPPGPRQPLSRRSPGRRADVASRLDQLRGRMGGSRPRGGLLPDLRYPDPGK